MIYPIDKKKSFKIGIPMDLKTCSLRGKLLLRLLYPMKNLPSFLSMKTDSPAVPTKEKLIILPNENTDLIVISFKANSSIIQFKENVSPIIPSKQKLSKFS